MLRPITELGVGAVVVVLSAATALSAAGCSPAVAPPSDPAAGPTATAAVDPGLLPPPEALRDVMVRLTDPTIAGTDKLVLIQNSVPTDATALDGLAVALQDTDSTPITIDATDIQWAPEHPETVVATIRIAGPHPVNGTGELSFPMEFGRTDAGWQLTRETADLLLVLPAGDR